MPTNFYSKAGLRRKSIKLTCLFLFLPLFFFGQSLTGLWIGTVSNDSTTVRKDQSFEIALTEYKGKVYGYSRSEFIVDDVLYYIVKRVSGTIEGDVCEVTDDEIVSYNFPKLLDKKVKVTSTFRRDKGDSVWYLAGKWKTNVTKKYYSVSGRVDLEEEKDLTASKIFPHLEELKLADAVVFYKERKEGQPIVKIAKPEKTSSNVSTSIAPLTTNSDAIVIADKPIVMKNTTSSVGSSTSTETTVAVKEIKKEQPSTSIEKNTTTTEEPVVNTDLASVKRTDNTQKTETKSISSSKVDVVPSSNKIGAITKPVAEEKNSTVVPDVVFSPVLEKKNETASAATKNNTVKQEAIANKNQAVVSNTPSSNPEVVKTNTTTVDKKDNNNTQKQDVGIITKKETVPNTAAPVASEKKETVTKQDVTANTKPVSQTETPTTTTTEIKNNNSSTQPTQNSASVKTNSTASTNTNKKENNTSVKQDITATSKPAAKTETTGNTISENKIVKAESPITPTKPEIKTPSIDITLKAAIIAGRKSEFSQQVNFKSDSLQVSLYDNGEIDGDTVSVFMNGEVIMAKQGLKSSAIRKTIYLTPDQEEFTLVLFAENLGKYPPNTGLLVVRDGDDVYNLRFSSDFQKNTGIVFRRKK